MGYEKLLDGKFETNSHWYLAHVTVDLRAMSSGTYACLCVSMDTIVVLLSTCNQGSPWPEGVWIRGDLCGDHNKIKVAVHLPAVASMCSSVSITLCGMGRL